MGLLAGLFTFLIITLGGFTFMGFVNPERRLLRQAAGSDHVSPQRLAVSTEHFALLEIDEMDLPWPSDSGRGSSRFSPLPWPSSGWDDEHFGKALQDDELPALTHHSPMKERDIPQHASLHRKKKAKKKAKKAPIQDIGQQTRREMAQEAGRVAQEAQGIKREVEEQFFQAVEQRRQSVAADLGFDPGKVPAMVKEHGLAGAVEKIRKQTGWDFKRAAQFVAKALRG